MTILNLFNNFNELPKFSMNFDFSTMLSGLQINSFPMFRPITNIWDNNPYGQINYFQNQTETVFPLQNDYSNMPWTKPSTQLLNLNNNYYFTDTYQFTKTSSTTKKPIYTGSLKDYDAGRGEKLARIALKNSVGWTSQCATYVKDAIQEAGLGSYVKGDAHQTDEILSKNKNFKRIAVEGTDVDNLPAGCVLVYEKGAQGYNKEFGHVEITTGDGRGVSDGITNNLRKPSAIFIPVSTV